VAAPDVKQNWKDDRITQTSRGWTATLSWNVAGNNLTETDAKNSVPMALGQTHPRSIFLFCNSLDASRSEGLTLWQVKAEFSTSTVTSTSSNPLNDPPRWRWEEVDASREWDFDSDGNGITNSSTEPPQNSPQREAGDLRIVWARNEPFFSIIQAQAFRNRVNLTGFTIGGVLIPPFIACIRRISPNSDMGAADKFVRVQYNLEFREPVTSLEKKGQIGPWEFAIPDRGYQAYYSDPVTKKPTLGRIYVGKEKFPIASPVRLYGYGNPNLRDKSYVVTEFRYPTIDGPRPQGAILDWDGSGSLPLLRYKKYEAVDFGPLGFS
jgi:hypothetical protein